VSGATGPVVGIDLGGTKIHAGLVDAAGTLIAEASIPTHEAGTTVSGQIARVVSLVCEKTGMDAGAIAATGIGGAGAPQGDGFALAPNLEGTGAAFGTALAALLGHPVVLDNDVNVAALGELERGVGAEHQDFVVITVGTGIGMGIIAGGALVRGASGAAGEIGFLPFGTDPLRESSRRRGALEDVVAGDAIVARYRELAGADASSHEVFRRAADGDAAAIRVVDDEARWIATAIAAVRSILDPGLVVLGGGIGSRTDLLERTRGWMLRLGVGDLPVRHSTLGALAPVFGAARLAREHTLSDTPAKGQAA
jgi:glucokinase